MDRPEIILAPGPTPIPPEVLLAQGSPLVYHRGPGFGRLMREVTARLKELYRTDRADVLLMTSSGTGGLESAVQNVFSPGDEVLVPLAGLLLRAVAEPRHRDGAHRAHGGPRVGHRRSIRRGSRTRSRSIPRRRSCSRSRRRRRA